MNAILFRIMPPLLLLLKLTGFVPSAGAQGSGAPARPAPVRVAVVALMPLAERVEALGTLQANESVTITANVTEIITAIQFDDGQRVPAGAVLVELNRVEQQALLEEARVRVDEAERQYERVRALTGQKSAAESLLDERRRDLDAARAMVRALESRLADRLIRAPFAGVLGLRRVSRGALIQPGEAIVTLDDDSVMKLDFTVPSVHLTALRPGLAIEARAAAFGERVFEGRLGSLDSRVDPVTRAIPVRALLPNPERALRPGLLMRVELLVDPRESPVIPESALLQQGDRHFVMRIRPGAAGALPTAERQAVRIGTRRPGLVEVREGLTAGDRVVVDGQDRIRPDQPLAIEDAAAPAE